MSMNTFAFSREPASRSYRPTEPGSTDRMDLLEDFGTALPSLKWYKQASEPQVFLTGQDKDVA